jgi:pimeloyl-ACP methyl ester carboxylesterase
MIEARSNGIWSEAAGPEEAPLVALVHGSMDRSSGVLKLSRRLDTDHRVVRYDRRGYGRSRPHAGPFGIEAQVEDLVAVLNGRPAVVFGHSYGGNIALALAMRRPDLVRAVAVYETPLSWLEWWPGSTAGADALATRGDPADAAERFVRRMIGDERWARLPATTRVARRREGVAMVGELTDLRDRAPWDGPAVTRPVVAMYGSRGRPHHRMSTDHLAKVLPDCRVVEITGARHFGPNTHPVEVAAVIAHLVLAVGSGATAPDLTAETPRAR